MRSGYRIGRTLVCMISPAALVVCHQKTLRVVIKPASTHNSQPRWTKPGHLPVNDASDGARLEPSVIPTAMSGIMKGVPSKTLVILVIMQATVR